MGGGVLGIFPFIYQIGGATLGILLNEWWCIFKFTKAGGGALTFSSIEMVVLLLNLANGGTPFKLNKWGGRAVVKFVKWGGREVFKFINEVLGAVFQILKWGGGAIFKFIIELLAQFVIPLMWRWRSF